MSVTVLCPGPTGTRNETNAVSIEISMVAVRSRDFRRTLAAALRTWAGRPTPLSEAPALSRAADLRIFLKREDLLHGGAHKTNNVLGQVLLAKAMGKKRIVAETGAG